MYNFLELRPEVKVTVTKKQYVTLYDQKMYPNTNFGISTSNNVGNNAGQVLLEVRQVIKVTY